MMITLPKSALNSVSEDGEDIAPAVGDQVDLSDVVGMVTGEEGDNLQIELKSVNGTPCSPDAEGGEPADGDEAPATGGAMNEDALRAVMAKADQQ